jgi:hypothetical protein
MTDEHECAVNYMAVHGLICRKYVRHTSFRTLHESVILGCPPDYVCVEPIALHHEALWGSGRSVLHHAIEEQEYPVLWRPAAEKMKPPPAVCVRVVRVQGALKLETLDFVGERTHLR